MKKYTYPKYAYVYDKDGKESLNIITKLYQIGTYVAVYSTGNSIPEQYSLTPGQAVKFMKQFDNENLKGGYYSELGPNIVVGEVNGFWEEIK